MIGKRSSTEVFVYAAVGEAQNVKNRQIPHTYAHVDSKILYPYLIPDYHLSRYETDADPEMLMLTHL
jgi:hypothetical protein